MQLKSTSVFHKSPPHNLNFELHGVELRLERDNTVVGLMEESADITNVPNDLNHARSKQIKLCLLTHKMLPVR